MRQIVFVFFLMPLLSLSQNLSFEKGVAFYDAAQYQQAKPHFEAYLKSNPTHIESLEYLGDIAAYASNWDVALKYYKKLVESQPQNANFHFKYGGVLGRKAQSINKLRAALLIGDLKHHLQKAAQLDPSHLEVRWALIDLYIALPGILGGSEEQALKYATQLMKLSEIDGYLSQGYIAEYFDRPQDAENYYKKAMQLGAPLSNPRNNIYYQLGKISGMYNIELEKGLQFLNQYINNHSVKDGVPLEWAFLRIAQIYKHQKNKQQAQKWVDKAISYNTSFKEAINEKAQIQKL